MASSLCTGISLYPFLVCICWAPLRLSIRQLSRFQGSLLLAGRTLRPSHTEHRASYGRCSALAGGWTNTWGKGWRGEQTLQWMLRCESQYKNIAWETPGIILCGLRWWPAVWCISFLSRQDIKREESSTLPRLLVMSPLVEGGVNVKPGDLLEENLGVEAALG